MSKIILIGCGKLKRDNICAARDLYCGSLFDSRRQYAERQIAPWLILSAKHGLLNPDTIVSPYDLVISDLSPLDQVAWSAGVVLQLCEFIDNDTLNFAELRDVHCEIHAGAGYAERLVDVLTAAGFSASWPVKGLSQGLQMKFYADRKVVA